MDHQIEVVVFQLTNRCDLNCKFCQKSIREHEINLKIFQRILKENSELNNPIKIFELGWGGDPLLHKNINSIFRTLYKYQLSVNIVTNGYNLIKKILRINSKFLELSQFVIYLCSSNEKRNDQLMGKNVFKKTMKSMQHLRNNGYRFEILMPLTSKNYNDIDPMLNFSIEMGANLLLPIEIFPSKKNRSLLLTDKQKAQVMVRIDELRNNGLPLHKVIHFENPIGNCTYLRYKRLFINSKGNLAFCHFLAHLPKTEITDCRKYSFEKLLQINNIIRRKFAEKKEKEINYWKLPRKTASPCSYCIQQFGVRCKW